MSKEAQGLTWDNLAALYNQRTGRNARIMPLNAIYNWAVRQPEIQEREQGLILKKEELSNDQTHNIRTNRNFANGYNHNGVAY